MAEKDDRFTNELHRLVIKLYEAVLVGGYIVKRQGYSLHFHEALVYNDTYYLQ